MVKQTDNKNITIEEEIKYALDQSSIVARTDPKGVITEVNDKFCEISGYSREELIGQTHKLINSGHHNQDFFRTMWKTISKGFVWRGEICNRKKNGDLYWVDTTIVPLFDNFEKVRAHLVIRFEVTDKKNAESALFASSKLASLGEMAGGIAHEIKNPLGIINETVGLQQDLLSLENIPIEKVKKCSTRIQKNITRIDKIIKSLKAMSRNSNLDDPEIKQPCEIVANALSLCESFYKQKEIKIITPPTNIHIFINCNESELIQVLINLISNACDALKNADRKEIHIEVAKENEDVIISVTDTGPGIEEANQNRIFEPFFTTKDVGKGTGLGLSLSKKIVENHGGQLYFNFLKDGTQAIIKLPSANIK